MKWPVVKVKACGAYSLDLTFKDGMRKRVDLLPLLEGPVFEPLRDPKCFATVQLDPVAGTVVWPNGADIAPETLYELASETSANEKRASSNRAAQSGPVVTVAPDVAATDRMTSPCSLTRSCSLRSRRDRWTS